MQDMVFIEIIYSYVAENLLTEECITKKDRKKNPLFY